jgi:spore germination protein KB
VSILLGLLIARLVMSLSLRFLGKTLVEYAEEILGKTLVKIVSLLYIWVFFYLSVPGWSGSLTTFWLRA